VHSDHPSLIDLLDRKSLIETKAEQIANCKAPQTFGIHGDWGAGKTSFLKQLRFHLDGLTDQGDNPEGSMLYDGIYENEVVTIWFDAWQYQHEAAPIIALLQEIRRQFGVWATFKNKAQKLGTVAVRSVMNSLDDITKLLKIEAVPFNIKGIQKTGEEWEKQNLESKLGVDTIQSFLQQAIDTILKELIGEKKRLVIFIDDLDRCSSESAYRLLEGLKIYLNLNNCVFVLGMNQKIIVDAIAKQITPFSDKNSEASLRIIAEGYLEKLCTNIERLSPPNNTNKLILKWIDDDSFRTDMEQATRTTDRQGNELDLMCFPPNPRRLKSLTNVINQWVPLINFSINVEEKNKQVQGLLILAYVYQFHSELYQRWQFTPHFFSYLSSWAIEPWERRVDSSSGESWPEYLACLELPQIINSDPQSTTPQSVANSSYPDPYSVNMFWIQSLMRHALLTEQDIELVLKSITETESEEMS